MSHCGDEFKNLDEQFRYYADLHNKICFDMNQLESDDEYTRIKKKCLKAASKGRHVLWMRYGFSEKIAQELENEGLEVHRHNNADPWTISWVNK